MRKIVGYLALPALSLIASPAAAADNLACMNSGYDDEQLTLFAEFAANYDHAQWSAGIPPDATVVIQTVNIRASQCAAEHGWSPIATAAAVTWRFSDFLWTAMRLSGQLAPDQVTSLGTLSMNPIARASMGCSGYGRRWTATARCPTWRASPRTIWPICARLPRIRALTSIATKASSSAR